MTKRRSHVVLKNGLVYALVFMVLVCAPHPARAWGRLGHRVIARLAEQRLTPKAKAEIAAVLAEGESLADASTWADDYRRNHRETAPWHYIDIPLDEPRYDARFSADDPKKGCVVDKINEFKLVIKDKNKTIEERRFALRFLVHCLQDMHQPCHVGDNKDRGGNDTQVRFYDRGTNMHRLWDSDLLSRVSQQEEVWLKELAALDTQEAREAAAMGTPEDWATESLLAARTAYNVPETGQRLKSGQKLGDAYVNANMPVVRERLYRASVRLATVLNEAFADR